MCSFSYNRVRQPRYAKCTHVVNLNQHTLFITDLKDTVYTEATCNVWG